ncbi:MAG: DUF721 domain-containing protein [Synergistaceae bacterium]|nr:DUF721 domain-containing protein [Synergistaceae bacterium]
MSEEFDRAESFIDIYAMFPQAAIRAGILEELKRSWPLVVRNLAKSSEPYCLGVNELYICTNNPKAAGQLMKMKGNILRSLSRYWGYEPVGEFTLRITGEKEKAKKLAVKKTVQRVPPKIYVSEERVQEFMQGAPKTLPEDINYSISHLRAFLEELERKV